MELFGWIAVTLGMVLFIVSFVQMVRPNPDARIPYFRNPEFNPSGTIAARSISVGLLVIGVAALASTLGYWAPIVIALPLIVMPATIAVHNHRLTTAA